MIFPFITFSDGTEIVYSDLREHEGKKEVLVRFERWNDKRDDFDSMECFLPNGKMTKVIGFSDQEAAYHNEKILMLQDMVIECAKEDTEALSCR